MQANGQGTDAAMAGHPHHNWLGSRSTGDAPLDAKSAGFWVEWYRPPVCCTGTGPLISWTQVGHISLESGVGSLQPGQDYRGVSPCIDVVSVHLQISTWRLEEPGCEESPTQLQPGDSEGLERNHPGPGREHGDRNSSILIQNSHINYSKPGRRRQLQNHEAVLPLPHFPSDEKWSGLGRLFPCSIGKSLHYLFHGSQQWCARMQLW